MNLRRRLTRKELILIIAVAAVLCAVLYYFLFYSRINDKIRSYDTSSLDSQIQIEQVRAEKIRKMNEEVKKARGKHVGIVAAYDNLSAEMNMLDDIFGGAYAYSSNFDTPKADGDTVRRNVTVEFVSSDYSQALRMIRQIYDGRYRNQIVNIEISPASENGSGKLKNGRVSGSVSLTFYETLNGAKTKEGLAKDESSSGSSASESSR